MTDIGPPEAIRIPASHLDLLAGRVCGVLTMMGDDGQPQSTLVRVDADADGQAVVDTPWESLKGRNLAAGSKVSLLVVDPDDTARFIQLRGDAELRQGATRVICRIRARRITLDAIHA